MMNEDFNLHPKIHEALIRQIVHVQSKPPEGVKITTDDINVQKIFAEIEGPIGTPYEGGIFKMVLNICSAFPAIPPKGYFITKIFHPNISQKGEICVNTLKKDWDPKKFSLFNILEVIKCLLIVPFPESSLNEEAGKLFMEDYWEYASRAKLMTSIYAMKQNDENKNVHMMKGDELLGKRHVPIEGNDKIMEIQDLSLNNPEVMFGNALILSKASSFTKNADLILKDRADDNMIFKQVDNKAKNMQTNNKKKWLKRI